VATILETQFAAVDFESAGVRPGGTDVPVQAGVVLMIDGEILPSSGFRTYIASDEPITWRARKVHGIGDADLKGAPAMSALWPQFRESLGNRWVVAHGAATERRFLRAFPFHGFGPWVDTLKLSRAIAPGLPSHTLGDLIHHFGLYEDLANAVEGFRWHDAYCDALASLVLLRHFISALTLWEQSPDLLLRADDAPYHRGKSGPRSR